MTVLLTDLDPRVGLADHAGLTYSKLAPIQKRESRGTRESGQGHGEVVRRIAQWPAPAAWPDAFARWVRRTPEGPARRVLRVRSESPVVCGLGEVAPGDNGLAIHHVHGVPYLPGSSLKGVARRWCVDTFAAPHPWAEAGEDLLALFGTGGEEGAAAVDFLDALWEPSRAERPFVAEVTTPHHRGYYEGARPPDGTEGPVPLWFLAARGTFRVVLEGHPDWLDAAADIVTRALSDLGVGARTRTGQGRMTRIPGGPAPTSALEHAGLPGVGADPGAPVSRPVPQPEPEPVVQGDGGDTTSPAEDDEGKKAVPPLPPSFGTAHRDPATFPTRKREIDPFAKEIAVGAYDAETVQAALAHLSALGAKGGTLRMVQRAYGIAG